MASAFTTPPALLVALGGAVGAVLRYQAGRLLPLSESGFPIATLGVNVLGSLFMGLLAGWLARHGEPGTGENIRLLVGVGLLGGFTTFSAFSLELVVLAERGQAGLAALYAGVSIAAGVAALFAGLWLTRSTI